MSSRSLNKVLLLGNLTADPEIRYTPQGTAVCTFSIATNRNWLDQSGQPQEQVEFTRCVAWAKRAEVCSQLLYKGRKAFVEGRLQTREWEAQDKTKRRQTEVIIDNMIALGAARAGAGSTASTESNTEQPIESSPAAPDAKSADEAVPAEDIPF